MTTQPTTAHHVLSVLVENKAGVLTPAARSARTRPNPSSFGSIRSSTSAS